MKINIKIKRLTLHGFDFHDHKKIGDSMREELKHVLEKNGLDTHNLKDFSGLRSSIRLASKRDPNLIGKELASTVYQSLKQNM